MENVLEPEAAPPERFTLQEYFTPTRHRRLRRFPHLLRTAIGIVWTAARRELLFLAGLQLAIGAGIAIQLLAIRALLSDLLADGGATSFSALLPELIVVSALGALVAVATVVIDAQQRVLGQLVALHASDEVIRTAAAVDLITYDSPEFHDRLQRAQLSASQRPAQMVSGLLAVVGAGFAIGGIVVALLVIEPLFCGLVLVAYVPAWLATNRAARLVYRFSVEQTERERRRMYLFELLTSKREAQEVRAFDLGEHLGDRHRRIYEALIRDLREVLRRRLRVALAGQLVTAALTAGALAVLVWFVVDERMSLSQAGAAASAMVLLTGRLRTLSTGAGGLYESSLYLEDYATFVAARPRIEATRPSEPAPADPEVLTADAVSFTYPSRTRPSLVEASLTLRRGEVVALVGENGSGKTTFAKLLAGLYEPQAGTIAWDGVDAATLDPRSVRSRVAVIFQDFVRYLLSAHDNIALGDHARSGDGGSVEEAARAAGIHDALGSLGHGYETLLGPEHFGGSDLSGGQWQRVALARAFFRDAPVVILDEPTASLDPRAEAALYERMRELYAGRGVLLITHRFGSVRTADRIYVLRDGRVVERGSHRELMDADGHYAELFRLQASSYVD
ncbi:MAG TPA: ABC transporter ATP-binding protein [Thermoleophilaceae bacterium]|nr:ABC transporter ATP-binding protein [Thermoleophilaceae bacterium]